MTPTIRPAKPVWENAENGKIAKTALGQMKISKGQDKLWRATLNDAPFPILYGDLDLAKESAKIILTLAGNVGLPQLEWIPNSIGGETAQSPFGTIHIAKSDTVPGFFLMDGEDPASIPMGTEEQAMEACAQYLSFVWVALSEIVKP